MESETELMVEIFNLFYNRVIIYGQWKLPLTRKDHE